MTVYLHIGFEKTGSTAIQAALRKNRELLSAEGILYPEFDTNSNVELYNYSKSLKPIDELRVLNGINSAKDLEGFREGFREKINEIFSSGELNTFVLSNENLSSRLDKIQEVERLYKILSRYSKDIKVLIYIRDIYSFIHSSYSTSVKQGCCVSISEFIGSDKLKHRYKFGKIISLWGSVFGEDNLIIKDYSSISRSGDLVEDFFKEIGAKGNYSVGGIVKNKSLDEVTLAALVEFNKYAPLMKNGLYNKDRGDFVSMMEAMSTSSKGLFEFEEFLKIKNIIDKNKDDIYFDLARYSLSMNIFEEPSEFTDGSVLSEDLFEIFSKSWIKKQNQYLSLKGG